MDVKQKYLDARQTVKGIISRIFVFAVNVILWPPRVIKDFLLHIADYLLTRAKTTAQKVLFLWLILVLLITISFILYAAFYTFYVPTAEISRPVHLAFSVCTSGVGMCSFPSANISFWNDEGTVQEMLGSGQAYRVVLDLDMPDSTSNRELGMFMVVIKMYDREGQVSVMSQRSAMLKYRSVVMRVIDMLVWSPLYFIGFFEEKQFLSVELFAHFVDDYYHPSVGATIEVHSHKVEIYSATLKLFAKFTGLKYFLYYWPFVSALCAFWFNLFILASGLAVVLYQRNETIRKMAVTLQLAQEMEEQEERKHKDDKWRDDDDSDLTSLHSADEREGREQSTQTKASEEDDPETYDLPLVQEPADFGVIGGHEDPDIATELRYRRIN